MPSALAGAARIEFGAAQAGEAFRVPQGQTSSDILEPASVALALMCLTALGLLPRRAA